MADSFQSAYAKHVRHFLDVVATPEPGRFGPGLVTDMCRCGHERGEHWDGEGTCDPQTCGCRTFRAQQAD